MAVIGGIEIEMMANLARLRQDMEQAKGLVSSGARQMQAAADMAKAALGGLAAGLTVGAFAKWVQGAIDAAESLHDLSIQTGATVESLSAMAQIGRTTDTSAQDIGNAMNKLAKNMAVANEESKGTAQAIKALGLDFNTFKALKPEDQMVQLAKALDEFEDGGNKSALAMTLLGKSGAQLLPFMKDLASAGALVATTTSDQAAMADEWNDSLTNAGGALEEVQRGVAFALLPSLIDLVNIVKTVGEAFTDGLASGTRESASELDVLGVAVRVIGTVLETIVLIGSDVVFMFKSLGTELGGIAAQAAALLRGDFASIGEIHNQMAADAAASRAQLEKFQTSVAGATDKVMQARDATRNHSLSAAENSNEMARLTGHYGATSKKVLQYSADTKDAAKATKGAKDAVGDYIRALEDKLEVSTLELINGEKLSDADKLRMELQKKLEDGTLKLTEAQLDQVHTTIEQIEANGAAKKASEDYAAALQAVSQHTAKLQADETAATAALREQVVAMIDQADRLRLGEKAYTAKTIAADRARAGELEYTAAMQGGNFQLEEQARLLRQRADLAETGVVAAEAKTAADEWKKTTDSIDSGLTDALFRGLEKGQSMWLAFRDTIVNTFKNLVLQPTVKAIMAPATAAVGGLFSTGAQAGGGAGGAGGGGLPGMGWLTDFGGSVASKTFDVAAGLSNAGFENAGAWLSNNSSSIGEMAGIAGDALGYLSAFGDLTKGNYGAAAGAAIGTYFGGPIGATIGKALGGMADKLFGGGHDPHYGGYALSDAAGNVTDITQLQGGKNDAGMQEVVGTLAQASALMLNNFSKMFGGDGGISVKAAAEFNQKDAGWGFFEVLKNGGELAGFDAKGTLAAKGEEGFKQFTAQAAASVRDALQQMDIPKWAADTLRALGDAPSIDKLVATVQQINATKEALEGMADAVAPLGGVFGKIAGLSSDAQFELAQFTGGIEQFLAKTASYVSEYFTDEEQAAIKARDIMASLTAVGLDGTQLTQKGDLRRMMDSIDPSNEQGRMQIAALLNINKAFADLSKYLETSGLTLTGLAAIAPGTAQLDQLATSTAAETAAVDTATATKELAVSTKTVATNTETTAAAVTAVVEQQADALPRMLAALQDIATRVATIEGIVEREAAKP